MGGFRKFWDQTFMRIIIGPHPAWFTRIDFWLQFCLSGVLWLFLLLLYSLLSLLYTAYSIVVVAIGMSEPRDWPHFFGSPLNAYTVRNCWGEWINQITFIMIVCLYTVASGTKCSGKCWQIMLILSLNNYVCRRASSHPLQALFGFLSIRPNSSYWRIRHLQKLDWSLNSRILLVASCCETCDHLRRYYISVGCENKVLFKSK